MNNQLLLMARIGKLLLRTINGCVLYCYDYFLFRKLSRRTRARFSMNCIDAKPCLYDRTATTSFDRHYIFHTAWAARILAKVRPSVHYDISGSLYFASICSAFIAMRFFDYRPATLNLSGLTTAHADLLSLPFSDNSIESLSCMHVVEHVGLGRYGDSIDPDGDIKAMKEIGRVLSIGGNLIFVVPIGIPRIMFNAHRIYSYSQIISYFDNLDLQEFSLICDDAAGGAIVENASQELADQQRYGCGLFWFRKAAD